MKILFVSRIKNGKANPFVYEQGEALKKYHNHDIKHYLIEKGGLSGYFNSSLEILKIYKKEGFEIIHAHNGLAGLSASFSKIFSFFKIKLVITFHGTDINDVNERKLSVIASKIADYNILVSSFMKRVIPKNSEIIPCGIDMDVDVEELSKVRDSLGWSLDDFVILFSSSFDRKVKDPEFAFQVIDQLRKETNTSIQFLELHGLNRSQVNAYMQGANLLLMCSISEGSPQVVKEAILNGLPILSNDVGEVRSICKNINGCFIEPKIVDDFVWRIKEIIKKPMRISEKEKIEEFDNKIISDQIDQIYHKTK
jgi:glycosyltransferase involved in cell wall biosynthesis